MALKEKFVFICILLIHLSVNQSVCDVNSQLEKKIDVEYDRQGLIGTSLLGGPLALAAFLFSIPLLPALLMAPLAISGIGPAIGAVGNFMSNIGGIGLLSPISNLLFDPPSSESSSSSGSQTGIGATVSNTLRGLTDLLFNRRYQQNNFQSSKPQQLESDNTNTKPDKISNTGNSANSPTNSVTNGRFATLVTSLKDIYGILKNGLRRYEITNSDCQSRIICEVHQKSIARSYGSVISKIFDLFGIDDKIEKQNRNDMIKHFVKAARIGLSNNQCENVYYRCVSNPNGDNVHNSQIGNGVHSGHSSPNGYIDHHSQHYFKQRPAIKSSLLTTPRTVHYYSNANKL